MEVHTTLTGPFPRSEALVAATRDLDRGRTSGETVRALFRETEAEVRGLEGRLGLDPKSGGYLAWADLFRPFAETWGGFTVGPVTRWFETNTFFRQPILHAPPERVEGALDRWWPIEAGARSAGSKATLPGPYTFVGLLDNRSGETREALTHRMGRLLADEVRALRASGYGNFQFQEPLLVVDPPEGPLAEATVAAYRAIADAAAGRPTLAWTFFADAAPSLELLARLPVTAIGIDVSETEPGNVTDELSGRALGFGCLDPRTTLSEDPAEIAQLVGEVAERLHPASVWLGPGGPLDLLPFTATAKKLEFLPKARALLERAGGSA
jgi:5-methyltetrahydropteroyltriglutamate--homocysteine methyltransferase